MDFRQQTMASVGLAGLACDALVLVVPAEVDTAAQGFVDALGGPLSAAVRDAVASGDLKLKGGKAICLHRVAGVTAPRLVLAVAGASGPLAAAAGSATAAVVLPAASAPADDEIAAPMPASTAPAAVSTTLTRIAPKAFKSAVANALSLLKESDWKHLALALAGPDDIGAAHAEAAAMAVADGSYVYRYTKPSAPAAAELSKVTVVCGKPAAKAVQQGLVRGKALAAGVTLARECANRPANHCTPTYLAEQAKKLGKEFDLKVDVLGPKEVEKLGMGAFLAVAKGSDEPLRFIVARYEGAAKSEPPIVLVGKGITFDSGGISIKPAAEMDEMKYDMGGAASVLGTLRAVAELKPKLNLVVIVPSCENMLSGRSVKPGDVVTSMSGKTIEILNTDAEGRLILCDALTYAERFKPAMVIDVATLTGACVVALGHHHSGLFTADDALADALLAASRAGLDPCWRMPLDEEYGEGLKSNFADIPNIGGRPGGAITAAVFLSKFTGAYRWAHLDIAGTAWKSGSAKGATGRPVPLLSHFVLAQAH